MPQSFITRAVIDAVAQLRGFPNLRILDLSCGEGEILVALADLGCHTLEGSRFRGGDYIIENDLAAARGIPLRENVDLSQPLPYEDQSADVVILTEVLEHLEIHSTVIYEAGRILRPGGFLVFTTPNIHRLHSRWHFLLSGSHKLIRRRIGWDVPREELYAYHIHPVDLPSLHTVLSQAGIRIHELRFTRFKWKHVHWLLAYPLVVLSAFLEYRARTDSDAEQRGERDLFHWMISPALLFSEQLFVIGERIE